MSMKIYTLLHSTDDLMLQIWQKKLQTISVPCHIEAKLPPATEGSYWFPSWSKHLQTANTVSAFLSSLEGTELLATDVSFSSVLKFF